jgi:hypothetical protein
MTPTQTRIHNILIAHGFEYSSRSGTKATSYINGYVNVVVGPRGRIISWVAMPIGDRVFSVDLPLSIL